jgi:hypothetical protein
MLRKTSGFVAWSLHESLPVPEQDAVIKFVVEGAVATVGMSLDHCVAQRAAE